MRRVTLALMLASELTFCPPVLALNPALHVKQYSHTTWKISDGFSIGVIRAITQTTDGYLWLGTELGLLRFDGVRALPWEPPGNDILPSDDIWSVLATRDGALWIGTAKGLARWKNGALTRYPQLGEGIVQKLLEGANNTVWVSVTSVPAGQLCAVRNAEVNCFGGDGKFWLWSLVALAGSLGQHVVRCCGRHLAMDA